MPTNQINPFNYNIDVFDSVVLGPLTTDTDFRTYLFSHNLPVPNSVISGVLGGNPWQDRATEYDVSQSNPSVVDVPNLLDVAQTPSLYNNLSNPRQVNLSNNLQNLSPEVQGILGQTTPIQAGLGQDASASFNPTTSNIDLPSPVDVAQNSSNLNNFTTPRYDNLAKNPTPLELITWNPIEFAAIYNQYSGDYDTSYGVSQTLKIGFVGNVEEWVDQAGITNTTKEIREIELFSPANNKYGPQNMVAYSVTNGEELVSENTGLIQYNTGVEGDFRDQLFSRTLGVGIIPFSTVGSGINYKPDGQNISELDKIARKQRGVEVINRTKLNFVDNTVGALNVSPFALLGGGNLIEQNYSITVPKRKIGKAAQFLADLVGFNLPKSIIPAGAFGKYGTEGEVDGRTIDISNDILDYTGSGQKSLLYNALYINKYAPTLASAANPPTTKLGKIIKEKLGAGQAPVTINYLTDLDEEEVEPTNTTTNKRGTSLIEGINNKIKKIVGKGTENPKNLRPSTTEDISSVVDGGTDDRGGFYGKFEPEEAVGRSFSEKNGFDSYDSVQFLIDYDKPVTTYKGTNIEKYSEISTIDEKIDWRIRSNNTFKKGILKYTQDIVNKAKLTSAGGYIGYFDSNGKEGAIVNGKHQTGSFAGAKPTRPSKGNVTTNISINSQGIEGGGDFYCRSWSSRRKYHTWNDLIRSDGNWWKGQSENTNMTMNWGKETVNGNPLGMPKIAWNSGDELLKNPEVQNVINGTKIRGEVIPYMLSIENLAWKDAPQFSQLPECEKGPNQGRIMWFPPYNIEFSESNSINWDTTSFIGRGENIYTYNNSERTGTLDFTIVVDHPEVLNVLKRNFKNTLTDEGYNAFFAGCNIEDLKKLFNIEEDVDVPYTEPAVTPIVATPVKDPPQLDLKFYFDNNRRLTEENGKVLDLEVYEVTTPSLNIKPTDWANGSLYSCGPGSANTYTFLNTGKLDNLDKIAKFLATEDGKNYDIKITAYTSPAKPEEETNEKLSIARAQSTADLLNKYIEDAEFVTGTVYLNGEKKYPSYDTEKELQQKDPNRLSIEGKPFKLEDALSSEGQSLGLSKEQFDALITGLIGRAFPKPTDFLAASNTIKNKTEPGYSDVINKINTEVRKCPKDCPEGNPCDPNIPPGEQNSRPSKLLRFSEITLTKNLSRKAKLIDELNKSLTTERTKRIEEKNKANERDRRNRLLDRIASTYITECEYFEQLKRDQPFIYQSFAEKIKYFHPAFHSITPEGFNSRLTFLLQCTRQGPQMLDNDVPQNMVFGRPPVLILRIGDFYNTKIIVDSVNINYEPLQWDLNPEGIGVQPMLAKVSLAFKFVGGSSLGGPIKQLQNAVSYNFFANTGVYRPAKVLEEETEKRYKFIYGAFLTPEEANAAYAKVAGITDVTALEEISIEENEGVNTDAELTEAGNTLPEVDIIAEKIPKGEDKGTTDGDTRPVVETPSGKDVDFKLIGSNELNPKLNPNAVAKYYLNLQKPDGNYIVYEIKDNRTDCCVDDDGLNVNPSISITSNLAITLEEALGKNGKVTVTTGENSYVNGQRTFSYSYEEDVDYNWDGKLNITIFYNPGKNKTTGFQQEVTYSDQIIIL